MTSESLSLSLSPLPLFLPLSISLSETESSYVSQAGLKLAILLPQSSNV